MKIPVIKKDILATLAYFNMFDYPLTKREVYIFLGNTYRSYEFEQALFSMTADAVIFRLGDFYSMQNNFSMAERRIAGNKKAVLMLKRAEKAASLIAHFPFVKAVAVSGSLSKNFAGEQADIDFFIITATGRLWIARSFLHAFKKITYLFKMQHSFCMNYFIDESAACILEKNIYTATEVVTLLPMRGVSAFDNFFSANHWTKTMLPNNYMRVSSSKEVHKNIFKYTAEKLLNNRVGGFLDHILMILTVKSWNIKTRRRRKDSKGILMGLHAGRHFSKPDPAQFQQKILNRYNGSLNEIYNRYEKSYPLKDKLV